MVNRYTRYFVGDYTIEGFKNISAFEASKLINQKVAIDTETTMEKELVSLQIAGKDFSILVDCNDGIPSMILSKLKKQS